LRQSERQLGAIELTLALASLLVALNASWANAQAMNKETFDWHWGSWRVKVSENQVFIYRHQARVLKLLPPPETDFKGGRWQGPTASLKFQGSGGEGVWFLGLTVNGLNLVAQHTVQTQSTSVWRWAIVNPNLLRGASNLPSSDEWSGMTLYGAVTLNIGGTNAQTRWRQTDEGFVAELVYPTGTKFFTAQLEVRLPPHWILTEQP